MTHNIQPIILCGGSGTRLWPLSRAGFPKQFLCLGGTESLFQQSVQRLAKFGAYPYIVSNNEHRFVAQEQLREIGINHATYLLEPAVRNTAPALTLAALATRDQGTDPILIVTPADQTVLDSAAFDLALQKAIAEASQGHIVVLGVTPSRAETGFGYIQSQSIIGKTDEIMNVKAFVEKPDAKTAQKYLLEGHYFWNAGIFVLKASAWLEALKSFRPDILQSCQAAWAEKKQDGQFIRPDKSLFEQVPIESVDYAVMERCPGSGHSIRMVPLDAGWSDLGTWEAVWNIRPKDDFGNSHHGDVTCHNSQNTLVHASSRLVALVGVSELVVVETPDAVLVVNKSSTQDVKQIVNSLIFKHREEQNAHRKVQRPWGWYDSIDEGTRFKVKRIQVKPKASLSLQKHHHRAEHWVVVKGTAEITIGDKVILLSENQSTYIPLGVVHRLANPGTIALEIIEVQSGCYLGEDDIIRLEDNYGRSE